MGLLDSAKKFADKAKAAADTNKDGKVDKTELEALKKHLDFNKDGKTDSKDLQGIKQKLKR